MLYEERRGVKVRESASECRRGAGQSLVCLMRMRKMKVNLGLAPASSCQSADRIVKVYQLFVAAATRAII